MVLIPYPNPGVLADAASTGVWDVGFIGAEPQRAHAIDFTAAYVEIEATGATRLATHEHRRGGSSGSALLPGSGAT